ncbi:MAG: DUF2804 domain-containing protein [Candidatus Heimdallarchaeota archaeon]|nr:DUF2804 domain-containing protein [Candidatus Heimdallarchaeota archaeon]
MQTEITEEIDLLDEHGHITKEGYAKDLLWKYDRSKIKASWLRIKEWDYYYMLNEEFGLTLTVADLGYIGFAGVAFLDLTTNTVDQADTMSFLPRGKMGMPSSSKKGNVYFSDKKMTISFDIEEGRRVLKIDGFIGKEPIEAVIELVDQQDENITIATSWAENRKRFYYNQKINCFPISGSINYKGKEYTFDPQSSFGGLDWGRGAWTYKNRWYWASASGVIDGKRVGWNLGYGFTDRTPASENMLFYDGKAHKIEDIEFIFDKFMDDWKFTSSDGRFEMTFKPAIDRASSTNLLIIKSIQHQVFGYYTGFMILDDGTKIEVNNFLGFAEDVLNYW